MHRKNLFTMAGVALIVLFLTGGCGPKADPAMVSKVNSFFAAQTDKTYKGAKNFSPVPLAVGQYVTHGNTEKNGKRSVTRTAIVGKESGGWILENYSVNEYSESCSQMLIKGMENIYNPGGIDNIDILWVKIKDENGQIQTIDGPALTMAKSFYKKALQSFDLSGISETAAGGDITVPAGTFTNTFRADAQIKIMGMTFTSQSWIQGKVPVNSMVKSVTDNGKITSVLLDFGYSGATPCF
jgi:hypothetical protein